MVRSPTPPRSHNRHLHHTISLLGLHDSLSSPLFTTCQSRFSRHSKSSSPFPSPITIPLQYVNKSSVRPTNESSRPRAWSVTASFQRPQKPTPVASRWHLSRACYIIANPLLQARHVCVLLAVGYNVTVALVPSTPHGTGRQPHGSASLSAPAQTSPSGRRWRFLEDLRQES